MKDSISFLLKKIHMLCMCVHACVYMHVCTCTSPCVCKVVCICICMHVESIASIGCLPQLSSTLFETGSLIEPRSHLLSQSTWPRYPQGSGCLCHWSIGITVACFHTHHFTCVLGIRTQTLTHVQQAPDYLSGFLKYSHYTKLFCIYVFKGFFLFIFCFPVPCLWSYPKAH